MKHSDKICGINVQLAFPESWGDPTTIIDLQWGKSLSDVIHEKFGKWIDEYNENVKNCWMTNTSNGFDVDTVCATIDCNGNLDAVDATIGLIEQQLIRFYESIPPEQIKLMEV